MSKIWNMVDLTEFFDERLNLVASHSVVKYCHRIILGEDRWAHHPDSNPCQASAEILRVTRLAHRRECRLVCLREQSPDYALLSFNHQIVSTDHRSPSCTRCNARVSLIYQDVALRNIVCTWVRQFYSICFHWICPGEGKVLQLSQGLWELRRK